MNQKRLNLKNETVKPQLSSKNSFASTRSYPAPVSQIRSLQHAIGNQQLQKLLAQYQPSESISTANSPQLIQRKINPVATAKVEKALSLNKFITDFNSALKTVTGVTTALKAGDFSFFSPEDFVQHSLIQGESDYYGAKQEASGFCTASRTEVDKQCKAAYPKDSTTCVAGVTKEQKAHCNKGIPDNVMIGRYINIRGITHSSVNTSLILFDNQKDKIFETVVHEGIHRLRSNNWALRSKIGKRFYYKNTILPPISRALDEGSVHTFTGLVIAELQKKQWLKNYQSSAYANEIQYVKNLLKNNGKTIDFLKKAYFDNQYNQDVELLQYWASQSPFK